MLKISQLKISYHYLKFNLDKLLITKSYEKTSYQPKSKSDPEAQNQASTIILGFFGWLKSEVWEETW